MVFAAAPGVRPATAMGPVSDRLNVPSGAIRTPVGGEVSSGWPKTATWIRSLGPRVKSDQSTSVDALTEAVVDCGSGGAAQAASRQKNASFVYAVVFTNSQSAGMRGYPGLR